jgi:hypothetical protein
VSHVAIVVIASSIRKYVSTFFVVLNLMEYLVVDTIDILDAVFLKYCAFSVSRSTMEALDIFK